MSDNETGFKLERKSSTDGSYVQIAEIPAATSTWLDEGVAGGGSYDYRLRATNESGDSPYSNEATSGMDSTAYDLWAANYPAFLALSPEDRLPGADPNEDGVNNLLAYAMAADPLQPAALPIIQLAALSPVEAVFRFRRNLEAPDLVHEVMVSGTLAAADWTAIDLSGAVTSAPEGAPAAVWVEVPLPAPPPGENQFARLRVTRTLVLD
jgi:hypothetical protein